MPPKTKDLGSVIDGRIRKAWPVTAPGGPIRAVHSMTKGLQNPGVLCYRNSVLQCLLHIPEFFNYLCNRDRCRTPGDGCVFCSLRSLALAYWSNTDQSFPKAAPDSLNIAMNQYPGLHESDDKASYGFLKRSKKSKNDMNRSGQQDAHEYFLGLYGMLKHTNNDFLHRIRNIDGSTGPAVRNIAMHRLFQTKLRKKWTCDDCGRVTVRRDRSAGIELPMYAFSDGRVHSVKDHLGRYFVPETLNELRCDSAECNGNAADRTRISTIAAGPEILVIQLLRMRFDMATGRSSKILDRVEPEEFLDLHDFTERENEFLTYRLQGVVFHQGNTLGSGHYVAKVRRQTGNGFVVANDSRVEPSMPDLHDYQSYILMYQKVGGKMAKCI